MGHLRKGFVLLACLGVVFWGSPETTCSTAGRPGSAQAMETDALRQADEQVQQGIQHYEAGEYQEAIKVWEPVLETLQQANATEKESALSFLISQAYFFLGDTENFQLYYERGVELNPEAVQPLTTEHLPSGPEIPEDQTPEEALQAYVEDLEEILQMSRQAGSTEGEINALASLGITYYNQGDFETGIRYHQQALDVARQSENQLAEGEASLQIGHGYFAMLDYSLALEHYTAALAIFKATQNLGHESQVLINLGVVHSELDEDEAALNFYQQAMEAATAANRSDIKLSALIYSGDLYIERKQCERARQSLNEALTLAREIRDPAAE